MLGSVCMSTRCVTIKIIQSQDRVHALALFLTFNRVLDCFGVCSAQLAPKVPLRKAACFPRCLFDSGVCHAVCFGVMSRLGKAQRNQRSRCCQPRASPVRVPASSCILPFRRPFVIIFVLSHALPAFGLALSEQFHQCCDVSGMLFFKSCCWLHVLSFCASGWLRTSKSSGFACCVCRQLLSSHVFPAKPPL
jgi:hypothetical protein